MLKLLFMEMIHVADEAARALEVLGLLHTFVFADADVDFAPGAFEQEPVFDQVDPSCPAVDLFRVEQHCALVKRGRRLGRGLRHVRLACWWRSGCGYI
jgi:hypothetical protein